MQRTWRVRRASIAYPDGQQRWDRAYQLLLRWSLAPMAWQEGAGDASRGVRTSLNGSAAARADDRAAGQPAAGVRGGPGGLAARGGARLPGRRLQRRPPEPARPG